MGMHVSDSSKISGGKRLLWSRSSGISRSLPFVGLSALSRLRALHPSTAGRVLRPVGQGFTCTFGQVEARAANPLRWKGFASVRYGVEARRRTAAQGREPELPIPSSGWEGHLPTGPSGDHPRSGMALFPAKGD